MNVKEFKSYLKSYKTMDLNISFLSKQINDYYTYNYDFLTDINSLECDLDYYIQQCLFIRKLILSLDNIVYKQILEYKYIRFMTYDEISCIFFYSVRYTKKLHDDALSELFKLYNSVLSGNTLL